jgi:hypothetical protein
MGGGLNADVPNSNCAQLLDGIAQSEPNAPFCQILNADWRTAGARTLTFAEVARAVDRLCWWLDGELGRAEKFDTFAYWGVSDVRYTFVVIAAAKTQRQVS